jgi:hypothetical protein
MVVFGGYDNEQGLSSDLHVLDLDTLTWTRRQPRGVSNGVIGDDGELEACLPTPRYGHSAIMHDGMLADDGICLVLFSFVLFCFCFFCFTCLLLC